MKKKHKYLIDKFLKNELSIDETQELKIWLEQPTNKALLKKEIQLYHLVNAHLKTFDAEAAYNSNKQQLNTKKPTIPLPFSSKLKYVAVAASLVMLLALSYFFKKDTAQPNNIIVNTTIKIGTDKATLTLENGTKVNLDDAENYISNTVKSNGKTLIYNTGTQETSKITYNYLTIPRGGQYVLKLSDGTKVWLNSDSQLKYPTQFIKGQTRAVELVYGEAYFDVSASTLHNGASFKVHHKLQDIQVLGTQFNITAYNDDELISTTLVEGAVQVTDNTTNLRLKPEEASILNKSNRSFIKVEADILSATSWINGDFYFHRKPLKDILKVLSRWYDIDIIIENEALKTIEFTGELSKNQNIEEILTLIKNTKIITAYEVKNNEIIIK